MIENSMYKNQIDQKNSRILSLENRIKELEKQLEEANECLTIAYMQGFSDCKDKQEERIKELEETLSKCERVIRVPDNENTVDDYDLKA